jgi:uncharacterized protein YndB with AHSA1/START domain
MPTDHLATASISIHASLSAVWDALTNPAIIKEYMFGTEVVTDWKEGSPIIWKGIWKEKPYEDKGIILKFEPEKLLQVTHFSPLSGVPDVPENYHTLTYTLVAEGENTQLSLTQDNNVTEDAQKHSQQMWEQMLAGLKKTLEQQ